MTELKDVCELARELVIKYDTQERAAEAAKVHQNIISRLCRGERSDVRLSTYKRMIDALEKTVSQERIAHAPRTGADGLRRCSAGPSDRDECAGGSYTTLDGFIIRPIRCAGG